MVAGGRGDVTAGGGVKVGASTGAMVRVCGSGTAVVDDGAEVVAGGRGEEVAGEEAGMVAGRGSRTGCCM